MSYHSCDLRKFPWQVLDVSDAHLVKHSPWHENQIETSGS